MKLSTKPHRQTFHRQKVLGTGSENGQIRELQEWVEVTTLTQEPLHSIIQPIWRTIFPCCNFLSCHPYFTCRSKKSIEILSALSRLMNNAHNRPTYQIDFPVDVAACQFIIEQLKQPDDVIPGLTRSLERNQRFEQQDQIDKTIASFTANKNGRELEAQLQAGGIPAAMLQNSPELFTDPQLLHQNHFVNVPHHEGGQTVVEGSRIHMSRSTPVLETSAPTFNRDMMLVLEDILGYDSEKIGELLVSGLLE